jgi:hypothetical protein
MLLSAWLALAPQEPVPESPASEPAPVAPQDAGAPLVPGELPADVSEAALGAWNELCRATGIAGVENAAERRVRAFDLQFEGRVRPRGKQSNDFDIERFLYLDPGWVSMTLKSGRRRLRGPEGDYLVDSKRGTVVRLQGREMAEDIRELGDTVRIARTFVSMTHPGALRLARLRTLDAPPSGLPAKLKATAGELHWLELISPDFHSVAPRHLADGREPLFRVRLGLHPETRLPAMAVIHEDDPGGALETAVLLELGGYKKVDGFQVPSVVKTHAPDASVSPWVFAERPAMELWLLKGSLRPKLTEKDFLPPE